MKTIVKQLATATFIAFLFLVGNATAEGSETKASRCKKIETTLQLENWMTDETIWNTNLANVQETEAELELEDWMTNIELFDLNFDFGDEVEPGLELEVWMISDATWNRNNIGIESELTAVVQHDK